MKQMKFAADLVRLIISGEKTSTWRLWDDKDLSTGDIVEFIKRPELTAFAKAKLTKVVSKTLSGITDKDKKGHEDVGETPEEMYKIYAKYYGKEVDGSTPVKIIQFEILETYK